MGVNGIYGLSGSGLDVESLVKMGMLKKQSQYDKMQQTEIKNTWIKEAYTDVYSDLNKYKNITLSTYKLQSNMNAMAATSSDNSIVTATANGAAASMVHQVAITDIATSAYLQTNDGAKIIRNNTSEKSTSTYLRDILYKKVEASKNGDGSYSYTVTDGDGNTKDVNGKDVAISLLVRDTTSSTAEPHKITYTYDDLFQEDKTLNDFASAFSKSGANIQGSYDTTNDSFSLYNKSTGKDNIIAITANNADSAALLNNLQLAVYDGNENKMGDTIDFSPITVMKTTNESKALASANKSTSLKDVLGISANLVDNGAGNYSLTFKGADGVQVSVAGSLDELKNTKAFSMNLSNGTDNAEISFTYGELFDMDGQGELKAKGSLADLANKVNASGLGISAVYDESADSFVMSNLNGQALLTGKDATGNAMVAALNLEESSAARQYAAQASANTSTLADLFGVTSSLVARKGSSGSTYVLSLMDSSGTVIKKVEGSTADFMNDTIANKEAFSFNVSAGDESAAVSVKFGDLVDFSKFTSTGTGTYLYYKTGATSKVSVPDQGDTTHAAVNPALNNSTSISDLRDKINSALDTAGMSMEVKSTYSAEDGFQIYNIAGDVAIEGNANLVTKLGLSSVPATAVSQQASTGITRKAAASSSDSLKDIMGLSATYLKNGEDNYTVTLKDKDGHTNSFTGTGAELAATKAFSFGLNDTKTTVGADIALGELLDLSGLQSGKGSLNGNASMADFATKLTEAATTAGVANVKASYDTATHKLVLENAKGDVTISGNDDMAKGLVAKLGMAESESSKQGKINTQAVGTNASVTIDGKHYDLSSNKQTVAGVTYTFVGKTAGTTAKVTVNQDTDKIVDYVKKFVEDYNTLLDSLNDKLVETKYSDYKPLSTTQEDKMTETQINKWNEKAKSGLLNNSSMIRELVSSMREAIYTKVDAVDSKYNTMSAIGISSSTTKGHLTLDEDKLRKALAEDPDCVYQMFASDQDSTYIEGSTSKNKINAYQKKDDFLHTGVANRLNNVMSKYMSSISDYAGKEKGTDDQSYLGKLITNMQTKMKSFKTMMTAYESQLFKKYDAMEVALSKLGTQLSYITGGQ